MPIFKLLYVYENTTEFSYFISQNKIRCSRKIFCRKGGLFHSSGACYSKLTPLSLDITPELTNTVLYDIKVIKPESFQEILGKCSHKT